MSTSTSMMWIGFILQTILKRLIGDVFLLQHCFISIPFMEPQRQLMNIWWCPVTDYGNSLYWNRYCVIRIDIVIPVGNYYFLHARPWIPGDEIAIFTAAIHWWRSPLRQFSRVRTIDQYDVTMLVSYIRVTSQINCGDVTILNQKRLSLTTTAKSAIDNCFGGIECSGHQKVCKK